LFLLAGPAPWRGTRLAWRVSREEGQRDTSRDADLHGRGPSAPPASNLKTAAMTRATTTMTIATRWTRSRERCRHWLAPVPRWPLRQQSSRPDR